MNKLEEKLDSILELLLEQREQVSNNQGNFLTINQASDLICKSIHTVYGLVSRREIPHFKKGNRLYFKEQDLRDWLEAGSRKTVEEFVLQSQTVSLLNLNSGNNECA